MILAWGRAFAIRRASVNRDKPELDSLDSADLSKSSLLEEPKTTMYLQFFSS